MQKEGEAVTETKKCTLTEGCVSVLTPSDEKVLDIQNEPAGSGHHISRHC